MDKYGNTALHIAAANGQFEIVNFILKHIKEKNPENKVGEFPHDLAKINRHFKIYDLIVKAKGERWENKNHATTEIHTTLNPDNRELSNSPLKKELSSVEKLRVTQQNLKFLNDGIKEIQSQYNGVPNNGVP